MITIALMSFARSGSMANRTCIWTIQYIWIIFSTIVCGFQKVVGLFHFFGQLGRDRYGPAHFNDHAIQKTLSILTHEMAHLWQHRFGKRPHKACRDKRWAAKMHQIGLIPSDTLAPGNKEAGRRMCTTSRLAEPLTRPASSG